MSILDSLVEIHENSLDNMTRYTMVDISEKPLPKMTSLRSITVKGTEVVDERLITLQSAPGQNSWTLPSQYMLTHQKCFGDYQSSSIETG